MLKTCAVCGREYETKFPQSKCCSDVCRDEHRKRYALDRLHTHKPEAHEKRRCTFEPRFCAVCGREFKPKTGNAKYCSNECRTKVTNEATKRCRQKQKPPEGTRICAQCGKSFTPNRNSGVQKYCCTKCKDEHDKPRRQAYQREYERRKKLKAAAEKADYIEKNNQRTHLDDVAAEAKAAGQTYGRYVYSQTYPDGVTVEPQPDRPRIDTVIKLQSYCKQLQQLLTDVSCCRRTVGALGDVSRLKDCIVSETLQLYISGDLGRIEELINGQKESRP